MVIKKKKMTADSLASLLLVGEPMSLTLVSVKLEFLISNLKKKKKNSGEVMLPDFLAWL